MVASHLILGLRFAVAFFVVLACILIGWYLTWKLILVHIPLVQEIFGLRKKPPKEPRPVIRKLSSLYSANPPQRPADADKLS